MMIRNLLLLALFGISACTPEVTEEATLGFTSSVHRSQIGNVKCGEPQRTGIVSLDYMPYRYGLFQLDEYCRQDKLHNGPAHCFYQKYWLPPSDPEAQKRFMCIDFVTGLAGFTTNHQWCFLLTESCYTSLKDQTGLVDPCPGAIKGASVATCDY